MKRKVMSVLPKNKKTISSFSNRQKIKRFQKMHATRIQIIIIIINSKGSNHI
jgi:hypothetical protein